MCPIIQKKKKGFSLSSVTCLGLILKFFFILFDCQAKRFFLSFSQLNNHGGFVFFWLADGFIWRGFISDFT